MKRMHTLPPMDYILVLYVDNFMRLLHLSCHAVFTIICMKAWGHYEEATDAISTDELMTRTGLSKPPVIKAVNELMANKIVRLSRGRGRGELNRYDINFTTFQQVSSSWPWEEEIEKGKETLRKEIGTIRCSEKGISSKEGLSKPSQQQVSQSPPPSATVKNTLPSYLIEICDKINYIPRETAIFKREMKAAKEVVNMTSDVISHNGGHDITKALEWVVKIAQKMKAAKHWYLKGRSILPSTLHYCYDEIITMIHDEKKSREQSAVSKTEHELLKQREVLA